MREIMFALLDPLARRRALGPVLAAGCGTGHFARELARRYRWHMHSLDLGMEGLHYARGYGLDRLMQAGIRRLPSRAQSFDAVVSMDVIVHLARREEALPLAEFACCAPAGSWPYPFRRSIFCAAATPFMRWSANFSTRGRLIAAVRAQGFEVERVTYANSLLMPVALAKFRLWEPLTGRRLMAASSRLRGGSTRCSLRRWPPKRAG